MGASGCLCGVAYLGCPENLTYVKVTLVQHHPASVDGPLYFPSAFDYESFPVCKNAEG